MVLDNFNLTLNMEIGSKVNAAGDEQSTAESITLNNCESLTQAESVSAAAADEEVNKNVISPGDVDNITSESLQSQVESGLLDNVAAETTPTTGTDEENVSADKPLVEPDNSSKPVDDNDEPEENRVPPKTERSRRSKAFKRYKLEQTGDTCEVCHKTFHGAHAMEKHKIFHQKMDGMHSCTMCDKVFVYKYSLDVHLLSHSNKESKFACHECRKECHNQIDLARHLHTEHSNKRFLDISKFRIVTNNTCGRCGQPFGNRAAMRSHNCCIDNVVLSNGVPYHGDHCTMPFKRVKSEESGKWRINCTRCDNSASILMRHFKHYCKQHLQKNKMAVAKMVTRPSDAFLKCKHGEKLTTKLRHNGRTIYECTRCNKISGRLSRHISHIRTHTNEKPYKCDHCSLSFRLLGARNYHSRSVHDEGKPIMCEICYGGFSRSDRLDQHMRAVHVKASRKSYKCKFCPKKLYSEQGIQIHERDHTGELPYECRVCTQKFSNADKRRRHEKSQHNKVFTGGREVLAPKQEQQLLKQQLQVRLPKTDLKEMMKMANCKVEMQRVSVANGGDNSKVTRHMRKRKTEYTEYIKSESRFHCKVESTTTATAPSRSQKSPKYVAIKVHDSDSEFEGFADNEITSAVQKRRRMPKRAPILIPEPRVIDLIDIDDDDERAPSPIEWKPKPAPIPITKPIPPEPKLHHLIPDIFADFCSTIFSTPQRAPIATVTTPRRIKTEPGVVVVVSDDEDDDVDEKKILQQRLDVAVSNVEVSKRVHPDYVQFNFKVFYKP